MSGRKCVELTAIYSDGTVERWEGRDLAIDTGEYRSVPVAAEDSGKNIKPTTSRPLRRVTVVRGRHMKDNGREEIEGERTLAFALGDLLPDGAESRHDCLGSGSLCDFRIVVEAVPVEGEGT